ECPVKSRTRREHPRILAVSRRPARARPEFLDSEPARPLRQKVGAPTWSRRRGGARSFQWCGIVRPRLFYFSDGPVVDALDRIGPTAVSAVTMAFDTRTKCRASKNQRLSGLMERRTAILIPYDFIFPVP